MNRIRPRISVITATVNRCDLLRRAIESVLAQGLDDVEHIVVDNVSTDGTVEMLAEYPHLIVIREPDRCLYEAWNKGLRRASGAIFCFLNSDDEIPSGAFARVTATLAAQPNLDMISGSVEIRRTGSDGAVETRLVDDVRMLGLREQDVGPGIPLTNGRYFTPGLVARVGLFDERYRLVSDRDYLLRALLSGPVNVTVSAPLYRYHVHDESLTLADTGAVRSVVNREPGRGAQWPLGGCDARDPRGVRAVARLGDLVCRGRRSTRSAVRRCRPDRDGCLPPGSGLAASAANADSASHPRAGGAAWPSRRSIMRPAAARSRHCRAEASADWQPGDNVLLCDTRQAIARPPPSGTPWQ